MTLLYNIYIAIAKNIFKKRNVLTNQLKLYKNCQKIKHNFHDILLNIKYKHVSKILSNFKSLLLFQ